MAGLRLFQTLIAAKDRLYVDGGIYAFRVISAARAALLCAAAGAMCPALA